MSSASTMASQLAFFGIDGILVENYVDRSNLIPHAYVYNGEGSTRNIGFIIGAL